LTEETDLTVPGGGGQGNIAALQAMPIFGGIREDVLRFLLERCTRVSLPQDEYFFREDDPADGLFVLERGRVAVLKAWDGHQHLLGHLKAGDCFGEMALMDLFPRSASVLAIEPCTALHLTNDGFYQLYKKNLEQFALIQMNLGREVSRRLRAADERWFRMGTRDPYPVRSDGQLPLL
jgi:CRP-like cAMP-binding protein